MIIKVKHSVFGKSADIIDNYISYMVKQMNQSTDKVTSLTSKKWKHDDALEFRERWLKNNESGSVTNCMKASLQNYANSLRYAENQYRRAQSNAINRASQIF